MFQFTCIPIIFNIGFQNLPVDKISGKTEPKRISINILAK